MDDEADELIAEFVAAGGRLEDWRPAYSIAPTDTAPIVRERERDGSIERELGPASWGLRPAWAKGKVAPINARLETLATNGMFKGAFARSRCLVPMRGYFEWVAEPDGKQPYFLHGDGLLAAAGLYAMRKEGDAWVTSFTVVTREARDASGEVHERMPAFVERELWEAWLDPGHLGPGHAGAPDELLTLLTSTSGEVASTLVAHPVSRRINNVRTADPTDATLIAPA